jgi:hypothetical protein
MKKSHHITRGSDRSSSRPFKRQHKHGLISHPARPTQDRLDRGVDRLDDAEADRVIAVGGDPLDMVAEELAQPVHLRQALPSRASIPPLRKFNTPGRVV